MINRCVFCGAELIDEHICSFHVYTPLGDGWAESNRIMCDFFHRGKVAPRVPNTEWWEIVLRQEV